MRKVSFFFFFQAEDGIRDKLVTGVQTCALPICPAPCSPPRRIRLRTPPSVNVPEPIRYTPHAMSFVSHVECTICGHRHDAKRVLSVCEQCGQMLAVRYDLEQVNKHVTKEALRARPPGMYRFRELTPLDEDETPVTLGEGSTPLLALRRLAAHFGLRHVWGKDESQNPTGSFKARGLGMAITLARARGATGFVIPSAGNAGGAAARDAARRGPPCPGVGPPRPPPAASAGARTAGAQGLTPRGSIATAGKVVAKVAPQIGWVHFLTP